MVVTFRDGHDDLYHHAKFREIEQCMLAVGAKIWCLYVFCFYFHALRPACCSFKGHILNKYCVTLSGSIFDSLFTIFFIRDCSFRSTRECPFLLPDSATISQNYG